MNLNYIHQLLFFHKKLSFFQGDVTIEKHDNVTNIQIGSKKNETDTFFNSEHWNSGSLRTKDTFVNPFGR